MQLGFFTAILADRPLEEVAHGAAAAGFDGAVSVEHEDPAWGSMDGPVERRWEGLREALRVLRAAGT